MTGNQEGLIMKIFDRKPEFIAATCPHCGGKLELDVNFEVAYCKDCGTQCIIKNVRKRVKRTPLEKILEFTERQYNINRQDIQENKRMSLEKEKIKNELKEKRRDERNIWWNKHWLKVVIISLIVFVISLIYNYLTM